MIETRTIAIPGGRRSSDGNTIGVGFPEGLPIPANVLACGDGVHAFKPLTWQTFDDAICVCGTVGAGYPILMQPAVETILMLDVDVVGRPKALADAAVHDAGEDGR